MDDLRAPSIAIGHAGLIAYALVRILLDGLNVWEVTLDAIVIYALAVWVLFWEHPLK